MFAFGIMAFVVLSLVVLFHVERERGERFLPNMRESIDRFALRTAHAHARTSALFESDTVRQTLHYGVHMLLSGLRSMFAWVSERFDALIRINRSVAHRTLVEGESASHLHEMIKHKAATALTDAQKKQHKARAIGMRS